MLLSLSNALAQQLHLSILTDKNQRIIDSIGYKKIHTKAKSIIDETNIFAENLSKLGYLESKIIENKKLNDSTFLFRFDFGKQTKYIHIYSNIEKDTIIIPYIKVEYFLNSYLQKLEKQGFGLSKLKLINIKKEKNYLTADLQIETTKKRKINGFVIKGYDKFPEGFKKSLQKKYRNQIFNQDNLKKINFEMKTISFVRQIKSPEILFTTDSTTVYLYLEKAKTNAFDGFIGFTNDTAGDLVLNGYVDLSLNNALDVGEKLSIYWRNDGQNQKSFNGSFEIPFIFNSPLTVKTNLNIFNQDETFQNTKTAVDLGYCANYQSKVFFGYQSTESNDLKNVNSNSITDYKNYYYTSSYEFINFKSDDALFPLKTYVEFKLGYGQRNSKKEAVRQIFGTLNFNYHLNLTKKTALNLKSQNFYLKSDTFIVNELYRFGGINSIRGFAENALQANTFASIITEYQYIISPSLYLHSIIDYGYYEDRTSNTSGRLLGLGLGFGLQTKNGLLNFVYANGNADRSNINASNSIVQISLKTFF